FRLGWAPNRRRPDGGNTEVATGSDRPGPVSRAMRGGTIGAMDPTTIRALTFDVFGTVVDWRTSIAREGEALGRRRGLTVDWTAFADAWRGQYQPMLSKVRKGEMPWTKLDDLHRLALDR